MTTTRDINNPTQQKSDLSPYELLRLEKIRRNEARLEALGLGGSSFFGSSISGGVNKSNKVSYTKKKRRSSADHKIDRRQQQQQRQKTLPTRSSKRLKGQKAPAVNENTKKICDGDEDDDENNAVDEEEEEKKNVSYVFCYTHLPKEPDQLDDDEFQVYANLRSWRLCRKNELEVEPYKICQNRTLCELIRRVRNDYLWGTTTSSSANSNNNNNSNSNSNSNSNDTTERNEEDVANELIDCWGLGPSKVAAGGFGWEMMEVIGQEDNVKLSEKSRERTKQNKTKVI